MRTIVVTKEHGALDFRATLDTVTLWLHTCLNGKYTISMKKVIDSRTKQQNKIMWVWFAYIANAWKEATGTVFTKEEVHDAYCLLFIPQKTTPKGRVPGSTSSLNQEQMSQFLDQVKQDALESYGIVLPNAEDNFFAALAEEYSNQ
jgi:hypothetical protein